MASNLVTLDDILAARRRIAEGICPTPCPESLALSEIAGMRVFCKLEHLQRTGSFKERGARNALLLLDGERRQRGVIAASAGNHALALAYHGKLLGIGVTVVMPRFAPLIKQQTCRRLGARLLLDAETYEDARVVALEIAARDGLAYVHGFDDPAVIAGQGTLGLELIEQVPDMEAIVVPLGGGGLAAGIVVAVKALRPDVRVFGVEAQRSPGFTAALAAGGPVDIPTRPTLADGLAVGRVGQLAYFLVASHLERVVTVGEEELSLAILRLAELEKSVVEGAAAAPLAAALAGKLPELAGKRVIWVLTGGNIDPMILSRVIEHGLVADGRLSRFTAVVSDRPGGLSRLAQLIAAAGASVHEIAHERAFAGPDVATVNIQCTVETADREHLARLHKLLREQGIAILPAASQPEDAT
jgi:threonine dehydratase